MIINSFMVQPSGPANAHRYWRAVFTTIYGSSIRYAEIQFVSNALVVATQNGNLANVLSSNTVYYDSSTGMDHYDAEAFDNDLNDWWGADPDVTPPYIGFQLNTPAAVDIVYFYAQNDALEETGDYVSADVSIQSSDNGVDWIEEFVGSISTYQTAGATYIISR